MRVKIILIVSLILVSVLVFSVMYGVFDSEDGDLTKSPTLSGCFDSDASVGPPFWYETKGYCKDAYAAVGTSSRHVDSCFDSNTIVEWVCNPGVVNCARVVDTCSDFGYDGGCVNGRCVYFNNLVVGAPNYDGFVGINTGKVYVYDGNNGVLLWSQEGENQNDYFGSYSGVGDVNGDGIDDVIVGAVGYPGGIKTGKVYVYSGVNGALLWWSQEGENAHDQFGRSVSGSPA